MDRTNKPWWVYLVRCADGTLYTGISTDVAARIQTHNRGKGAKYTRARRPVVLLWCQPAPMEEVRKIERRIKQLRRAEKERLAAGDEQLWSSLQTCPGGPGL